MWLCVCVSFLEPKPGVSTETRRVTGLGSAGDLSYRNIQETPVSHYLPVASLLPNTTLNFKFLFIFCGVFWHVLFMWRSVCSLEMENNAMSFTVLGFGMCLTTKNCSLMEKTSWW